MDEFSEFSGRDFKSVDIATPEVLVGGLIGSMIIFLFTGLAISAVGRTAHEVRYLDSIRYDQGLARSDSQHPRCSRQ